MTRPICAESAVKPQPTNHPTNQPFLSSRHWHPESVWEICSHIRYTVTSHCCIGLVKSVVMLTVCVDAKVRLYSMQLQLCLYRVIQNNLEHFFTRMGNYKNSHNAIFSAFQVSMTKLIKYKKIVYFLYYSCMMYLHGHILFEHQRDSFGRWLSLIIAANCGHVEYHFDQHMLCGLVFSCTLCLYLYWPAERSAVSSLLKEDVIHI